MGPALSSNVARTTSHKVVIPFYVYGAVSFLVATLLLLTSGDAFTGHYFQPHILAITHVMALGWATMIILGASHQLVPVLIENDLYSTKLGHASFALAAVGIPLLVYGFYTFNLGWIAQLGGSLVTGAVLAYSINIAFSISESKRMNVHAVFVFTATIWLLLTVSLGLAMLFNFTMFVLPQNSLYFLSLHAHLGLVGWFLLLVLGVGSRLIPMFLISKYSSPKLLWVVYLLVNAGLVLYGLLFLFRWSPSLSFIPAGMVLLALLLFAYYCKQTYNERIRKKVDDQMKTSLLAVALLLLPTLVLLALIGVLLTTSGAQTNVVLLYGFTIFFGWLTAIILGMTFKTLPFIVWNKVYRHRASMGKMPSPKDLFSEPVYQAMALAYLLGFVLFGCGILFSSKILLSAGSIALLATAVLYNWNVMQLVIHKPFRK
ncbi:MAG: cytochrome C oxidase subunit I [Flavobacteriales bacterium]|nr:cytochrome C oxidase subunit I [Flavobacteriales bacterium]MBK6945406.1 cytochrome C oxidase subunit I [Flavobacteriales bacterium]MBK7241522.1 cytochrome C oxidase subunit I [Flavobacteriales bacterium]MBK9535036.1 cytochrome C oxidase subunit I [Flavobacteriales bacterium]